MEYAHYPTPGSKAFATPEVGTVRCLYHSTQGDLIAVVGSGAYVVQANGNTTKIGTISSGRGQVRMQDNGIALFIVDGTPKGGWYCSLSKKLQQGLYGVLTPARL